MANYSDIENNNLIKIIEKKQIYLISKVINFNKELANEKSKLQNGSISYFSSFGECLGYAILKFWIGGLKNILSAFNIFIKEIIFTYNVISFRIINANNIVKKYDKIIITTGLYKNFKNGEFVDNNFRISSKKISNSLWYVVYLDSKIPSIIPKNVIIFKNSGQKSLFKLVKIVFNNILTSRFSIKKFVNDTNGSSQLSKALDKSFKKILIPKIKMVLMPYEGQPYQNNIVKSIKEYSNSIKIKGFIHSYPSLPTHLIKKKYSPDKLIISSKDQLHSFTKYLGWKRNNIEFKRSARFFYKKKNSMSGNIYLPINIKSNANIIIALKALFKKLNKNQVRSLLVKNHPFAKNYNSNVRLENKINKMIKLNKVIKKKCDFSIFIGATGAIIEALELNTKVYHISEDQYLDTYSNKLWPNVTITKLGKNIFKYQIKKKGVTISFGKRNKDIFKYFN